MSEPEHRPTPSPADRRMLKRALGCGVEEFVARFGADDTLARVETELRRARRARSRKLYTLWSAVRAPIEAGMARHGVMMRQSVLKGVAAENAIQADKRRQFQIGR